MLKMEFDFLRQRSSIISHLRLSILTLEYHRFSSCHSPLFIPTDLEQFIHSAAIREGEHSQGTAKKHSSIETLWLKDERLALFCGYTKPAVSCGQQPCGATRTPSGKTDSSRELPTWLVALRFWRGACVPRAELLQYPMFNKVPKIGRAS